MPILLIERHAAAATLPLSFAERAMPLLLRRYHDSRIDAADSCYITRFRQIRDIFRCLIRC